MSLEDWMRSARKPAGKTDVIIDMHRTNFVIAAAAKAGKLKVDMSQRSLEQVLDILMYRDLPDHKALTDNAMSEALSIFALYENPSLHINPLWLRDMDYGDVLNIGVHECYGISPGEIDRWANADARQVMAKAKILAQEIAFTEDPDADLLDIGDSVHTLFEEADLQDLIALRDLIFTRDIDDSPISHLKYEIVYSLAKIITEPDFLDDLIDNDDTDERSRKRMRVTLNRLFRMARDKLADIRSIIEAGGDSEVGATWPVAGSEGISLDQAVRESDRNSSDWIVVKTLLKEVRHLPDCHSYDDAIRYRESKSVAALRTKMSEWNTAMKNGDVQLEAEIRKAIEDSDRELARLQPVKKIGGITNTIAFPVGVAELLIGTPPVASMSLGGTAIALGAKTTFRERTNRWNLWHRHMPG